METGLRAGRRESRGSISGRGSDFYFFFRSVQTDLIFHQPYFQRISWNFHGGNAALASSRPTTLLYLGVLEYAKLYFQSPYMFLGWILIQRMDTVFSVTGEPVLTTNMPCSDYVQ